MRLSDAAARGEHLLEGSCPCLVCQGKARLFEKRDLIGSMVSVPGERELKKIIEATGPYNGQDPAEGMREDRYWLVIFADYTTARFWEDRKCILLAPKP